MRWRPPEALLKDLIILRGEYPALYVAIIGTQQDILTPTKLAAAMGRDVRRVKEDPDLEPELRRWSGSGNCYWLKVAVIRAVASRIVRDYGKVHRA